MGFGIQLDTPQMPLEASNILIRSNNRLMDKASYRVNFIGKFVIELLLLLYVFNQ